MFNNLLAGENSLKNETEIYHNEVNKINEEISMLEERINLLTKELEKKRALKIEIVRKFSEGLESHSFKK